jgi:hypothetical protein
MASTKHVSSSSRTRAIVRTIHIDQPKQDDSRYYYVSFEVAPSTHKITISYSYDRANGGNALDLGLFDPRFSTGVGEMSGFRGWSGGRRSEIFVSTDNSTPGYLPGRIQAGTWRIILGLYRVAPAGVDVNINIEFETDESKTTKLATATSSSKISQINSLRKDLASAEAIPVSKAPLGPRWVSGDLHMHTTHSDGDWTIPQLVTAAAEAGLDFICITDHNTSSHHAEIESLKLDRNYPLVIRGEEITTYGGHANAWGLPKGELIDFRVQPGDQKAMSRVAAQTHQQGALISINHPFAVCHGCDWSYDQATDGFDAIEVWNGSWDNSDERALAFWDKLLQQGKRITAVASSDSHRTANPLGQAATHVAISGNLSEEAVLRSIREGRAYLTNRSTAPVVTFEAAVDDQTYSIGDVIQLDGSHRILFKLGVAALTQPATISLISDGEIVRSFQFPAAGKSENVDVEVDHSTYFRVEVRDQNGSMLALTNPIFVASKSRSPLSGDGRVLAARDLVLKGESEVGLEISARSPGASWARTGAEASAITIEVDGVYNQDLLLWGGKRSLTYPVMLGRLSAGKHRVTIRLNNSRSASRAQSAVVLALRMLSPERNAHHTADDLLALANSPILYQRPNTIDRYSDVPLLMYYEVSHPNKEEIQVRYTVVFSNEDGGTPTAALMARWGRAADIEWVYEFRARQGQIIEESYQGVSHEKKTFTGRRINGNHPALSVASDNNNFSDVIADRPSSTLRFALFPVAVDLHSSTRESVLDTNPSLYRVVAEELAREGKLKREPADENTISDPRNYVYVDLHAVQNGTAISVEVESPIESSRSDLGEPKLRIDRSGYFRTAIRMSSAQSAASIFAVTVTCHSDSDHRCEAVEVKSISVLDQDYKPRFLRFQTVPPQSLKPNQRLTIHR